MSPRDRASVYSLHCDLVRIGSTTSLAQRLNSESQCWLYRFCREQPRSGARFRSLPAGGLRKEGWKLSGHLESYPQKNNSRKHPIAVHARNSSVYVLLGGGKPKRPYSRGSLNGQRISGPQRTKDIIRYGACCVVLLLCDSEPLCEKALLARRSNKGDVFASAQGPLATAPQSPGWSAGGYAEPSGVGLRKSDMGNDCRVGALSKKDWIGSKVRL